MLLVNFIFQQIWNIFILFNILMMLNKNLIQIFSYCYISALFFKVFLFYFILYVEDV